MEVNCVWIFDGCISWREDVARKRPIGRSGHFSSVVTLMRGIKGSVVGAVE